MDSESQLNFSIVSASLINSPNLSETEQKEPNPYFPFKLEYYDSKKLQLNDSLIEFSQAKFELKVQKHFRDHEFNVNQNRNNFYQSKLA